MCKNSAAVPLGRRPLPGFPCVSQPAADGARQCPSSSIRQELMKLRFLPAILIASCLSSASADRPGNFRVIGPGGGGAMFNPTISPHDANTVLISCDMTGSYITHDGGQTWRMFNLRGVVNFFVFDPLDSKTMYAHATALWRSTDGGEQWNLVYFFFNAAATAKIYTLSLHDGLL